MFTVVSLFSGCGGSSLGYQMAGGKILLAVEWEDNAAETYRRNFPNTALYHGDVCQLTNKEIFKITGLKKGELDLLDGSPPCQGFSTSGKRKFTDDRNQLFKQYIRILKALEPRAFIMENVSGMAKGQMKLIFAEIFKELKESGYKVKATILNAQNYNIPQSRERLFFIGIRSNIEKIFSFPKGNKNLIGVKKICPDVLKCKGDRRNSWRSANLPCVTITKSSYPKMFLTKNGIRSPEISELKQIQSFPSDFQLIGSRDQQWARIGNSVPPLLSMALATQLKKEVFNGTSKGN